MSKIKRLRPDWDLLSPNQPGWKSFATQTLFENPWLRLELTKAQAPTGFDCDYGVVRFQNQAVGVLPLFDDGTVVLVGQMRFAFGAYSWEMPEGGAPFGEDPLEGAKRELLEEAGLKALHWQKVLEMDLSNSVTDEVAYCYLATGLSEHITAPDATENLKSLRLPFKTVLKSAINGEIRDAMTVATVLRAYHMAVNSELESGLAAMIMET